MACDGWFPVLRPHLSEALVGDKAWARLRAVAPYLPGDCLGVIEARLAAASSFAGALRGDTEGREIVDFSIRLTEPPQARQWVEHLSPPHLKRFLCRGWNQVGHPAPISSVWLEFDLDHEPERLPVPTVCARLQDRVDAGWLVDTLLPALHGRSLDAVQRRWVRRAVDLLPAGMKLLYAFSLLSRPGAAVRLELFGRDPQVMIGYLEEVVSREAGRRASDLAPLLQDADRYHLSFDLGRSIAPRIGLEGGFVRLPHREPRWLALFDRLVAAGLCSVDQRDAVFAWPGCDTLWTAPRSWPAAEEALGRYLVRCLSHIKLISLPHCEPRAKAYLLFQPLAQKLQPEEEPPTRGNR